METASLARYGPVARGFHWTLALLIIGSIGLGWYVMSLSYYDRWYYTSLEWHKALGMAALVLGVLNVGRAIGSRAPAPLASMAEWERQTTRVMHGVLFLMMVAVPLTGYVISTSAGDGIAIFGWFEVPAVLPKSEALRDVAVELHYYLAYGTAALVLLHVTAALKHQFVDRDDILSRML
jgi:cytochrome b561